MQQKVIIISAVVLVALLVIGFSFYQSFTRTDDALETTDGTEEENGQITYPAIPPEEVAEAFYNWYTQEGNPLPSEAYLTAESLSPNFKNFIKENYTEGNDLLICLVEAPIEPTIKVRDTQFVEDRATSVVDVDFVEEGVSFIVEFVLIDSKWKIDLVECFAKG